MSGKKTAIIGIFILLSFASINATEATDKTTISISPQVKTIAVGQSFSINITIEPSNPISSAVCNITFDPSILQAVSVENGGMFDFWIDSVVPGGIIKIDNTNGTISWIMAAESEGNVSEPGVFAIVTFIALSTGVSPINIEDAIVGSEKAPAIDIINGTVNVVTDTTPPTCFIVSSPSSITNSTSATFEWNGSDNITPYTDLLFSYKLDGYDTDWHAWTHDRTITYNNLPDGDYKFMVKVKDEAGNIGNTANVSFSIDITPPQTTCSVNPSSPNGNNGWYVSNVVITLSATDEKSGLKAIYYRIDAQSWQQYSTSFTIYSSGIHTIEYYSVDNLNNEENEHMLQIKIDKLSPTCFIVSSPSSITNSTSATFEWNGSDNITPYTDLLFSYKLDGYDTDWHAWTHDRTITYNNLPDGDYKFMVKVKDEAGNIGNTANVSFSIDTTPPSISNIRASPSLQNIGGKVNISCQINDSSALQGVYLNITYPDGSYNNISILANKTDDTYYCLKSFATIGNYNFTIYAMDGAGNSAIGHGTFAIADLTPPVVHISYPSTDKIVRGVITIRWNATDDHDSRSELKITIKYSNDDGATWRTIVTSTQNDGNYTWNTVNLSDGKKYRIEVIAYDTSANHGSDVTGRFTVDNTPPSLTISKPVSGYLYIFDRKILPVIGSKAIIIGKITVEVEANDSVSGVKKVEFYIDGSKKAEDNNSPYQWQWNELAIGRHEIKIKAYDNAGNVIEKSVEARVFNL